MPRRPSADGWIRLSGVTKWYEVPERHVGGWRGLFLGGLARRGRRRFRVLDAVSLDIAPGTSVALIGENGSGKSTLLKVLAGITAPDEGDIAVPDRLAALIELGAGFHPDLTGWENLFLQGRLMGARDADIRHRLAAMAEFSGLGRFLDAPLKTYSSGMQARLGFTVATHFDPDVVLVDEVLSVGDAEFQARSFARIRDFQLAGRTVVFVSHQLEVVEELCARTIWLEQGRVRHDGDTRDVVAAYREAHGRRGAGHTVRAAARAAAPPPPSLHDTTGEADAPPSRPAVRLRFEGEGGAPLRTHAPAELTLTIRPSPDWPRDARWRVRVRRIDGVLIDTLEGALDSGGVPTSAPRHVRLRFARLPLMCAAVTLDAEVHAADKTLARSEAALTFEIVPEVAEVPNNLAQIVPGWSLRDGGSLALDRSRAAASGAVASS